MFIRVIFTVIWEIIENIDNIKEWENDNNRIWKGRRFETALKLDRDLR